MNNKKKGLIPPKLNEDFLICGFKPLELLIALILVMVVALTKNVVMLFLLLLFLLLLFRIDNEINIITYFKNVYKYYTTAQEFNTKEVKSIYEYLNQSSYNE